LARRTWNQGKEPLWAAVDNASASRRAIVNFSGRRPRIRRPPILAEFWKIVERNSPILNKYEIALVACGVQAFEKGQDPFQSVDSLIEIRNALIHYRPEPSDDLRAHKKIEERVKSRFQLNPLAGTGSLWFPHRCLGSGCASWAILKVERFMTEFCQKLSIPSRFDPRS